VSNRPLQVAIEFHTAGRLTTLEDKMIYNTKRFKNGKRHGYLEFTTGKKVILSDKELKELEFKIRTWQDIAIEQDKKSQ
jgi:hypothetical protein